MTLNRPPPPAEDLTQVAARRNACFLTHKHIIYCIAVSKGHFT